MALFRAWTSTRTYCPVCDAPLAPSLGETSQPQCSACDTVLRPARTAPRWRRLVGGVTDLAILFVTAGLLNWGLLALVGASPLLPQTTALARLLGVLELEWSTLARYLAPFAGMSALYFGLFWGATGQTPGARWLGFRVVDSHGDPPAPVWTVLRVVVFFAGALVGLLGWCWTLFDLERRAWHDHAARTYVVTDA